jgi:hypothetical protein
MATKRAYIPALINLAWIGSFVLPINSVVIVISGGRTRQVSHLEIQLLRTNLVLGVSNYLLVYYPLLMLRGTLILSY